MKLFFTILAVLVFIIPANQTSACSMEPSDWKQIETVDQEGDTGVYAITDALIQFKDKFEREMKACGMPLAPITCTAVFMADGASSVSKDFHNSLSMAMEVVWPDATLLALASMPASLDKCAEIAATGANLAQGYSINLSFKDIRSSAITLNDHNFKLYQLYRLVMREEANMFVRVTDQQGTALFLDEFTVSPTILADVIISPLGGLVIRLEKNSTRPLVVDFGPVTADGDHVMRFNDAFHQPSVVPPVSGVLFEPADCSHNHQ